METVFQKKKESAAWKRFLGVATAAGTNLFSRNEAA